MDDYDGIIEDIYIVFAFPVPKGKAFSTCLLCHIYRSKTKGQKEIWELALIIKSLN